MSDLPASSAGRRETAHAATDLHAGRSTADLGERWMHELGVAFVQLDKHGRGFLWSVNRLMPSQRGREHSETLLERFRELCELLEVEAWDGSPASPPQANVL